MTENDWAWLTGNSTYSSTYSSSSAPDYNGRPVHGLHVLHTMLERCDIAAAAVSGANGIVQVDPMEIAQSVGEVATMLVAAGIELEHELDPDVVVMGDRLRVLGRRCQRVACPFVRGETGPEQRDEAWRVLQDIAQVLRELLDHPAGGGGSRT